MTKDIKIRVGLFLGQFQPATDGNYREPMSMVPDKHIKAFADYISTLSETSARPASQTDECRKAFFSWIETQNTNQMGYEGLYLIWLKGAEWNAKAPMREASQPDEFTLLGVLADIRQKTGVGDKVMLSELADTLASLIQNGNSAIDTNKILADKLLKREAPQPDESKSPCKTFTLESALDYLRAHNDGVYKITASKNLNSLVTWLLDYLQVPMRESSDVWKPISTAPKTEPVELLTANGDIITGVEWSERPVCMLGARNGGFPAGWASDGSECDRNLPMTEKSDPPTHWRNRTHIEAYEAAKIAHELGELSRSWTEDHTHENGNYSCVCIHCGYSFVGHKRRVLCKVCATMREAPQPVEYAAFIEELKSFGPEDDVFGTRHLDEGALYALWGRAVEWAKVSMREMGDDNAGIAHQPDELSQDSNYHKIIRILKRHIVPRIYYATDDPKPLPKIPEIDFCTASSVILKEIVEKVHMREAPQPDECRKALKWLVALKAHKDAHGKTPHYEEMQPKAWELAKAALKAPMREASDLVGLMKAVRHIIEEEKIGLNDVGDAAQRLLALCDDIDIALSKIEGE